MTAVISIPKQFGVQMVEHGYAVQLVASVVEAPGGGQLAGQTEVNRRT